jgi:hypothetical protein
MRGLSVGWGLIPDTQRSREMPLLADLLYLSDVMVARGGIEPPTRGFSVRCSTN